MRAVLGIDAAWTPTQPSGVAVELTNGWRLIAAAASYQRFHAMADNGYPERATAGDGRGLKWTLELTADSS